MKTNKKTSKSTKNMILLSISIITTVIFIIAATIVITGHYSGSEEQITALLEKTATQEALYLQSQITEAGAHAKSLALLIENEYVFGEQSTILYDETIIKMLNNTPIAFGMGYWFEPYRYDSNLEYYGPYFYKDSEYNIVKTMEYSNSDYDYFSWDWYSMNFSSDSILSYSEPFYDPILNTVFVTTSSKIIRNGEQIGVVSIDVTLREFINHLTEVDSANQTSSFLLSNEGYIISNHSQTNDTIDYSIFDSEDEELKYIGNLVLSSPEGSTYKSKNMLYSWSPIGNTGLTLVLQYSKNDLMHETYLRLIINLIIFIAGISLLLTLTNHILYIRVDKPLKTIIHKHFSDGFNQHDINELIEKEDEGNLTTVLSRLMDDRQTTFHKLQNSYEKLQLQNEEIQSLYKESTDLNDKLQSLLYQVEDGYYTTVYSLSKAIEAKDEYTNGHCENVVKYSLAIANELTFTDEELRIIEYSALLHDIGKIGVSSALLNKPGKLTDEEFEEIKKHSSIGFDILKDIGFLERTARVVYQHHERIDGNGYPNGLKNEEIDDLAKIISIADAYDAMTSSRSYRLTPMTNEKALSIIKDCAGSYYTKELVDILVYLVENGQI